MRLPGFIYIPQITEDEYYAEMERLQFITQSLSGETGLAVQPAPETFMLVERELPEAVSDIIDELSRGTSPNGMAIYRRLRTVHYTNPNVMIDGEIVRNPLFPTRKEAIKQCRKDLNVALAVLCEEGRRRGENENASDVETIRLRFHHIMERTMDRMERLPPGDTSGWEKMVGVFQTLARSHMALVGKPLVEAVKVSGKVEHAGTVQHQHAIDPSNAYSSWAGSPDDLGSVINAEFTEDIVALPQRVQNEYDDDTATDDVTGEED